MHHDINVTGRNVAKFRYQRSWTQDELVAKLQVLGCYMTRDILANIETQRCPVTDKQLEFFADVFEVEPQDFFPPKRHTDRRIVGLDADIVTRERRFPSRPCSTELRERGRAWLAHPVKK